MTTWLAGMLITADRLNVGAWLSVPLTNSWTNTGGGHANLQYRLTTSTEVEVIGRVSHAAVSGTSVLSTALNSAYWPAHAQDAVVAVFGATAAPTASPVASLDTSGVLTLFDLPTGTTSVSMRCVYSLDA